MALSLIPYHFAFPQWGVIAVFFYVFTEHILKSLQSHSPLQLFSFTQQGNYYFLG